MSMPDYDGDEADEAGRDNSGWGAPTASLAKRLCSRAELSASQWDDILRTRDWKIYTWPNSIECARADMVTAHKRKANITGSADDAILIVHLMLNLRDFSNDGIEAIRYNCVGTDMLKSIGKAIIALRHCPYYAEHHAPYSTGRALYPPLSFLRLVKFEMCGANGDIPCDALAHGSSLCQYHVGYMYICHDQLLRAGMADPLVRLCLNYLIEEYDTIPTCLPCGQPAAPMYNVGPQ
jgi:hypothetical protein